MSQEQEYNKYNKFYVNFDKHEIDCNCTSCNHELWDSSKYSEMPEYFLESMKKLQELRERWGKPMRINSGHRCIKHNRNVGGATKSKHLKVAFDVVVPKQLQNKFKQLAIEVGFNGIGAYPNKGFVHIDCLRDKLTEWEG